MILKVVYGSGYNLNCETDYYLYIHAPIIEYGNLLSERQINDLKIHGSTIICYQAYKQLGIYNINTEVKRLTGLNVKTKLIKQDDGDPLVLIEKVKNK